MLDLGGAQPIRHDAVSLGDLIKFDHLLCLSKISDAFKFIAPRVPSSGMLDVASESCQYAGALARFPRIQVPYYHACGVLSLVGPSTETLAHAPGIISTRLLLPRESQMFSRCTLLFLERYPAAASLGYSKLEQSARSAMVDAVGITGLITSRISDVASLNISYVSRGRLDVNCDLYLYAGRGLGGLHHSRKVSGFFLLPTISMHFILCLSCEA